MRSLILICGSAVLSVRCVSDLIPGTGQTRRHCDPLTIAPFAATGLVATLTPRIPRSASVRRTNDASFVDAISSATLRVMCGDADRQSDLVSGLNRNSQRRVSIRRLRSNGADSRRATTFAWLYSATLANVTIAVILLDCGWGRNPLA